MSTRDRAIKIIDKLNEEQLEFFVSLFGSLVNDETEEDIRLASYLAIKKMRKKNPGIDYDKELAEYREERFGH